MTRNITTTLRLFRASILGLLGSVLYLISAIPVLAVDSTPGPSCNAANLNQAEQLSWDHFRVFNPSPNPFFVVCGVPKDSFQANNGTTAAAVNVFFSTLAEPNVICTWRQLPGDPAGGTAAVTAISRTASAANTVNNVHTINFPLPNLGDLTNAFDYWTVVCALQPGTGINSIDLTY